MQQKDTQPIRILVLGAGYGGLMAALRVAGKTRRNDIKAEVTLVSASDVFYHRVMLHEYATHSPIRFTPIVKMLRGTGIRFMQGDVTALDADRCSVSLAISGGSMQEVGYDQLIYALGSVIERDSIPGVREHAYTFTYSGANGVQGLREILPTLAKRGSGRVIVIGGGATGIEGAAQIKATHPTLEVTLMTQGEAGAFKGARVQRHLRSALHKAGVMMRENNRVIEIRQNAVVLKDGEVIPCDLCIWNGGFKALAIAQTAGIAVNGIGQILVDPFMRSVSHPEIRAIGDAGRPVQPHGAPYRMSLFTAVVMGAHAADTLLAQLTGKTMRPLGFSTWGQAVAVGPRDAVGFATFPSDRVIGPIYRGWFAVRMRSFFVWMLGYFLTLERRWPGLFFWLGMRRAPKVALTYPLQAEQGA